MNREQNFTMRKNNNFTNTKATAFTIAEVLITLGIIGIVAAMTIPTLVKKYERYVLKKQFQTAYSLVSNAVQRMTIDNPNLMNTYCGRAVEGDANFGLTAPLEKRTKFAKDFSQYFKVIDDNFENPAEYFYRFKQPNYDQDTDTNGYNDGQFIINNGMMIANGYCWIGARTVILPSVTIGRGSITGANSTVTKSIPELEVWAGSPAKKISERDSEALKYELNYFPKFN